MKILIYSSVFYPAIGGIENLTLFLAREFVKAGHEVKVVTEQRQDVSKPLQNIEVVHSSRKLKQLKLFFWSDIFYMPNITLKGVWLLLFNPFKKWVISHNDFHLMYSTDAKTSLKKFLIKRATKNISVSKSVADYLAVESTVIYNCYNDDIFRLYPEEPRQLDFVFLGRLVSQKGCEMLIDACSQLGRPFSLNIIGDGSELEKLKAKVSALGLEHQVVFVGFMQNESLARMLNRHRVMIVPSLGVEGFGIVALEGLACGCRMLVSNAAGLAEAVDGHGELFQMGDTEALRLLLEKYLNQPQIDAMPEDRAAYLKTHSKESVARKYLEVFSGMSAGK